MKLHPRGTCVWEKDCIKVGFFQAVDQLLLLLPDACTVAVSPWSSSDRSSPYLVIFREAAGMGGNGEEEKKEDVYNFGSLFAEKEWCCKLL